MTKAKSKPDDIKTRKIRTHDGRKLTVLQLMREVKAQVLLQPQAYSQTAVCYGDEPACGTPACIAGWMSHILDSNQNSAYEAIHERVFGTRRWPWLFDAYWAKSDLPAHLKHLDRPTPEQACEAIDIYLREQGVL